MDTLVMDFVIQQNSIQILQADADTVDIWHHIQIKIVENKRRERKNCVYM